MQRTQWFNWFSIRMLSFEGIMIILNEWALPYNVDGWIALESMTTLQLWWPTAKQSAHNVYDWPV